MEDAREVNAPLLAPAGPSPRPNRHVRLASGLSWAANWLLLALKIAAYALSASKAVLASLADSAGAPGLLGHAPWPWA